tara:strand:- start:6245 stop:7162 length:918 start_codon:yes stop_codon:yes gene_type:complete
MKNLIIIFFLLYPFVGNTQCKDVFNNNVSCPTEEDSLVVYNNAIKVYDFYENNKSYIKTRSTQLYSIREKQDVFEMLDQAKKMFFVIRSEMVKISKEEKKFSAGKPKSEYKDISYKEYYSEVDDYRFYEREMENQIININAPAPLYDSRIAPILVNEYKCQDTSSVYFGDLVNIPLYIPVVVKPYTLLTSAELILRNDILNILPIGIIPKSTIPKKVDAIKHMIKRDSIKTNGFEYNEGSPIYAFNEYGSGALIGFFIRRKFIKIKPKDYDKYAVPNFARKLLNDDVELEKMLKIRFGEYYLGLF